MWQSHLYLKKNIYILRYLLYAIKTLQLTEMIISERMERLKIFQVARKVINLGRADERKGKEQNNFPVDTYYLPKRKNKYFAYILVHCEY